MSPTSRAGRGGATRPVVATVAAGALALQVGCYAYRPLRPGVPPVSERVAVTLTDRGRAALGDQLGAIVEKVEGLVLAADATSVTLAVYGTVDLRGGRSRWTGERVTVQQDHLLGYQERYLSRGRTGTFVAVAVAVSAAILTIGLTLTGDPRPDDEGPPPGESRRR